MKHFYLLLLFSASFLNAQNPVDFWTTPVADIEFKNGKIYYCISIDNTSIFSHIKPLYYPAYIMQILVYPKAGLINIENFNKLSTQLDDYLSDWHIGTANNRDKHIYLEICALKIIWGINKKIKLQEEILNTLSIIKNDLSIEISKNTELVLKLYRFVQEYQNNYY